MSIRRDPAPNLRRKRVFLIFWAGRCRQNSVQAEIHGRGRRMVGRAADEKEAPWRGGPGRGRSPRYLAELEGPRHWRGAVQKSNEAGGRGEELVFGTIVSLSSSLLGAGTIGDLRTEAVIFRSAMWMTRWAKVSYPGGLVGEFVGGQRSMAAKDFLRVAARCAHGSRPIFHRCDPLAEVARRSGDADFAASCANEERRKRCKTGVRSIPVHFEVLLP